MGATEIARKLGMANESSVRTLLEQDKEGKIYQTRNTADYLEKQLKQKGMIDVGKDVEKDMGITRDKLDIAIQMLENKGYNLYVGRIKQDPSNPSKQTTQKVLADKDKEYKEIYEPGKVKSLNDYKSYDNGETFEKKFTYPESMDINRIKIKYSEEGGTKSDGLIELRPGVEDISLGKSLYAQVRILVDHDRYMKGMAVYGDPKDFPDGVDVIFHTNKSNKVAPRDVLKPIKNDPENPFGSNIKDADQGGQRWYTDEHGVKRLGLINKRSDQNDWNEWADSLSSQFLSKQSESLVKKQLDKAIENKMEEFNQIKSLTVPTIRKYYLEKFASECDANAVDLKAASLPGQKYHVIIPSDTLSDKEIYAPGYANGTKLALVRYPHGGTFEIPILTVNNKDPQGIKRIGKQSIDAVCINHNVAERLSGADFDGDTVMCIPTGSNTTSRIISTNRLKDLENFDNKLEYGTKKVIENGKEVYYSRYGEKIRPMVDGPEKQKNMGIVSNLISDMTLQGATEKEIARAVRHSMVVIDAPKHKLDWKQSYADNGIEELQKKYQPKFDKDGKPTGEGGGAFTLISKSSGDIRVDKRQGDARINLPGKTWYDKNKPLGSLVYITAEDNKLYHPVDKFDKKTGIKTVKTIDGKYIEYNMYDKDDYKKYNPTYYKTVTTLSGKNITYNMNNKEEYNKYNPIPKLDVQGNVYYTNKKGDLKYTTESVKKPVKIMSPDKKITYLAEKGTDISKNMAETNDARTLLSPYAGNIERYYAEFANKMKNLANTARLDMVNTPNLAYSRQAANTFAKEVSSLNAKLNTAQKNSPLEREAHRLTNAEIRQREIERERDMVHDPKLKPLTAEEKRKMNARLMAKNRELVGAKSRKDRSITIDDNEWNAILAGAISDSKLKTILDNSDPKILRERAMPKETRKLNSTQVGRIKALSASGKTLKQIAEQMGVSVSTISEYLKGG